MSIRNRRLRLLARVVASSLLLGLLWWADSPPARAAPFDFTGHWTGTFRDTSGGNRHGRLVGDFVAGEAHGTFTGTIQAPPPDVQDVTGKLKPRNRVLVLTTTGNRIKVTGILNRRTATIKGTYHAVGTSGGGTFKLTRSK